MLLQKIWKSGIIWDDSITGSMFEKWNQWLIELKSIESIRIQHVYSKNLSTARSIETHTFCDASEEAYCSVIYLRIESDQGVKVILIAS